MTRLSVKQAAERVGVSESMIYQWCHERRLAHLRLGTGGSRGKILIEEADLDAFLMASKVESGDDSPAPGLVYIKPRSPSSRRPANGRLGPTVSSTRT